MNETLSFLGKSKSAIMAHFADSVEFLHWLYLPKLGLVLSFNKQICDKIGQI